MVLISVMSILRDFNLNFSNNLTVTNPINTHSYVLLVWHRYQFHSFGFAFGGRTEQGNKDRHSFW